MYRHKQDDPGIPFRRECIICARSPIHNLSADLHTKGITFAGTHSLHMKVCPKDRALTPTLCISSWAGLKVKLLSAWFVPGNSSEFSGLPLSSFQTFGVQYGTYVSSTISLVRAMSCALVPSNSFWLFPNFSSSYPSPIAVMSFQGLGFRV